MTVLVDDVNDNVPMFTSSTFHTAIAEDAPTGTDVLLVNSSDADVGLNGVVRYGTGSPHAAVAYKVREKLVTGRSPIRISRMAGIYR